MTMRFLNSLYFPKVFWILTFLKLLVGAFFASHFVTKGFLPFIDYFLRTGTNPYDYFFLHNAIVFPYPSGMLLLISPFLAFFNVLLGNIFSNHIFSFLLFRIPILFADIAIYLVLCKLLPSKEKKVLWLYYASPILFYINYYHGQLDVIPTAFLITSLYFLSLRNYLFAFLLLGIGLATKSHLFIVLPFYAIYLVRQKVSMRKSIYLLSLSLFAFLLINIPFVSSSYIASVFNNVEQQRLFYTVLSYQYKDLHLLLAPAALLICFYTFGAHKRLNFDSLILQLSLVFTILIALVPPMQGWFYWSVPLFIFFLIKYKNAHSFTFLLTNIFFIAFFVFTKDSDIFESASVAFPQLVGMANPYQLVERFGGNAALYQNILFTCLQISIGMNAYWCYRLGIFYNNLYMEKQKAFVLGIGGDSGVGKSMLSEGIKDLVGSHQTVILNGDDSHKWERNDAQWEVFTHLNPKANNIHKDVNHMYALIDGKSIERTTYDHKTGKFTKPVRIEKNQFIIFQGLHPFFLEKMRTVYDLKIFIDTEEELRRKWKLQRDMKHRGHSAAKIARNIDKRRSDAKKFIAPQRKLADWVIQYYLLNGLICVKYIFHNSLPLEELLDELKKIKQVKIKHHYNSTKTQTVTFEGKISKKKIAAIAYKLYPNVYDLIMHQPDFREDTQGINQLFFIQYLSFVFSNGNPNKKADELYL